MRTVTARLAPPRFDPLIIHWSPAEPSNIRDAYNAAIRRHWSSPGFVDTESFGRMEDTMPRTRRAYPPEFRQQIVELHRAGRSPGELAREFEPNEQTIRNWIAQADLDEGRRRDGLTTVERAELRKLRKENRQLRVEREILAKAAAWFARESDPISKKSSGS